MDIIGTSYAEINCTSFEIQVPYMFDTLEFNIIFCCVLVLVGLLAVTGNTITIVAIHLRKRQNQATMSNTSFLFVRSLCVADIIVGAFTVPFNLYIFIDKRHHKIELFCLFAASMDSMACTSSILHLLMMSGDRYLAICRPLVHRTLPRHIVYIALAVSWIVPCIMTFPVIMAKLHLEDRDTSCAIEHNHCFGGQLSVTYIVTSGLGYFYVPTIIIFILNYKIFSAIRRRNLKGSITRSRVMSEAAAAKTIGVILSCFFVCWFPLFVVYFLLIWIHNIPHLVFISVELLSFINCMLNPILYYRCNTSVKQAVKQLMNKWFARKAHSEPKVYFSAKSKVTTGNVSSTSLISLLSINNFESKMECIPNSLHR